MTLQIQMGTPKVTKDHLQSANVGKGATPGDEAT